MCISEQKANAILGKSSHLVTGHVHCWSCFPFNWKQGSLHNFPTPVCSWVKWRLSLMLNQLIRKTLLSIDLCDLCGLICWKGRLPKSPFIHLSPPTKSWEGQTQSERCPSLLSLSLQLETEGSSAAKGSSILTTCETSRSWSSSRRNLQLIMFHKLPSVGDQLFSGTGWGTVYDFGGLSKLQIHGGSGAH